MLNRPSPGVIASLFVVALLISCRGFTPTSQTTVSPSVAQVVTQTNGVGVNRQIAVVFSKPMDPASINAQSFVVAGVNGTVTYDAVNQIGAFKAVSDFAPSTTYNATITTVARDLSGAPLAAPFTFSFITRASSDTSTPEIFAITVAAGATCVPVTQKIKITFEEQMDSLTLNPGTIFITGVAGSVTYDAGSQVATLSPNANLAANTTFTVNVTTGVKDLAGNPLAALFQLTFRTGPCATGGIAPVPLCPFIGNVSVLAGTTVTNIGSTVISGNVGVSPGSSVTGFPPGLAGGAIHRADSASAQAQTALNIAYNDAANRPGGASVAGDLVGRTFTPGIYKSTSSLSVSGDVTLDAQGDPDAVFIFQITSTLITASASRVVLTNDANACRVFWQVGSSATLGTNSIFKGNILALTSISVTTGANLEGRALARNGAVTLDTNVIGGCGCP